MENQEINLEKVHRLIDSLQAQAKDGHLSGMLSSAQLLVAELQQLEFKNNSSTLKSTSVSVVMPFAAKTVVRHIPLEAPEAPVVAHLSDQEPTLQPPTVITEAAASEATDNHSFGNFPAPGHSVQPVQKELFTLEEEPDEHPPILSTLTPDQYPTSIPSDEPTLQQPQEPAAEAVSEEGPVGQPSLENPVVVPPVQQAPDFEAVHKYAEQAENTPASVAAATPGIDRTEEDKRKHLSFIHDNFSAWADYGAADAPTLVQNRPLTQGQDNSYNNSYEQQPFKELNEQLGQPQEEWAHKMQSTPIDNLASAIGINDRYLFISELFRGDESMYERSIITLNKFNSFPEAHAWSERELRLKLGWDTQNPITQQFEQLIKRRFMNQG
jgi:hypothetical protein